MESVSQIRIALVAEPKTQSFLKHAFEKLGACPVATYDSARIEDDSISEGSIPFERALQREDTTGVAIEASLESSTKAAKQALFSGKHVVMLGFPTFEKQRLEELFEIAEGSGKSLLIGFGLEYHPAVERLHDLITSSDFGRIRYVYCDRSATHGSQSLLRGELVASLIKLLGEAPQEVSTMEGSVEAGFGSMTFLKFPGERGAHIFIGRPVEDRIVVCGEKKAAVIGLADKVVDLTLYDLPVAQGEKVPTFERAEGIPVSIPELDSGLALAKAFLDCCKGPSIQADFVENILATANVLDAIDASARANGSPILVNEVVSK